MRQTPSIEAVYDHYGLTISGADRGSWRKAQCPLPEHEDQNPSASVNSDENVFMCHACDESGDSLWIIRRREGVGRAVAERLAKEIAGGGDSSLPSERGSSSLLPRRKGHRPGRGNWTPPWIRGGTSAGA